MMTAKTDIPSLLRENGIQPSVQRIAIMGYLIDRRVHPTAETIFSDLRRLHPTMSRTTVYNTLRCLVDRRLVNRLDIDPVNARYDVADGPSHGHFMCRRCGSVSDVAMPGDGLGLAVPPGLVVTDTLVNLRGYCPECARRDIE